MKYNVFCSILTTRPLLGRTNITAIIIEQIEISESRESENMENILQKYISKISFSLSLNTSLLWTDTFVICSVIGYSTAYKFLSNLKIIDPSLKI